MKTKSCILARRFFINQSGNSAVEYAIIVTLLAAALTATIQNVGLALATKLASAAGVGAWRILGPL